MHFKIWSVLGRVSVKSLDSVGAQNHLSVQYVLRHVVGTPKRGGGPELNPGRLHELRPYFYFRQAANVGGLTAMH